MDVSKYIPQNPEEGDWDVVIVGTGMGGSTLGYALAPGFSLGFPLRLPFGPRLSFVLGSSFRLKVCLPLLSGCLFSLAII